MKAEVTRALLTVALAAAIGSAVLAHGAAAKGPGLMPAPDGVTVSGSPYRYVAIHPRIAGAPTVVERIDRRGGRIDRWWHLRGDYYVPAVTYDGAGGGLSADGGTLVLSRLEFRYPPKESRFSVLDTRLHRRGPLPSGQNLPPDAFSRIDLRGFFSFDAISPDGSTIYLIHHLLRRSQAAYEVRAVDTASGRLLPEPIVDPAEPDERMEGLPLARATSRDGRWVYTLYSGRGREAFVHALDTVAGRAVCIDLPRIEGPNPRPFPRALRLTAANGDLEVLTHPAWQARSKLLYVVDAGTFDVRGPGAGLPWLDGAVEAFVGALRWTRFLAFTQTSRRPGNLVERTGVAGRSAKGQPIRLKQLGDPALDGELLVFGCIHGDECAAGGIQPLTNGCPDPSADIYIVPSLNPDGAAGDSRLNGRGVDLNRNFPSGWRRIGGRGDPQHSGPRPFSEPESRLAARIVRRLEPAVTIWFHQHSGSRPFVRAWGQSVPMARRFAHLARMPFHLLPWPAGTAPNWQNHRFPGSSSFVVELPQGALDPAMESRLAKAIVRMGRKVRED